jgi:hypothetical protein
MSTRASASFEVKSWVEKPFSGVAGAPRLTRATVVATYAGDLQGRGHVEYLMAYRADGTASFLRLERVVASLGKESGSFALEGKGTYDGKVAKGTFAVVPGSGTKGLKGLRGKGAFRAKHGPKGTLTIEYELGRRRLVRATRPGRPPRSRPRAGASSRGSARRGPAPR